MTKDKGEDKLLTPSFRFSEEVVFFIDDVIWFNVLKLANNLGASPGNAQLLFTRLCALHVDKVWQEVSILRTKKPNSYAENIIPSIRKTSTRLKSLCDENEPSYGEVAQRRKLELGDFYLNLNSNDIKLPSELSLDNIFYCCPQPLQQNYYQDEEFKKRLTKVLEHSNERYSLFRSCGLNPQEWYHRDVSIQELRELKALRTLAKTLHSKPRQDGNIPDYALGEEHYAAVFAWVPEYLRLMTALNKLKKAPPNWVKEEDVTEKFAKAIALLDKQLRDLAYLQMISEQKQLEVEPSLKTVYNRLVVQLHRQPALKQKAKVARFVTFDQWRDNEIGMAMLNNIHFVDIDTLNEPAFDYEEDELQETDFPEDVETIESNSAFVGDTESDIAYVEDDQKESAQFKFDNPELAYKPCFKILVKEFPKLFDPMMAFFFSSMLDDPHWRSSIETNIEFKKLQVDNLRYKHLQGEALHDQLFEDAEVLIANNLAQLTKLKNKIA
ncbi:hypothetical protein [Methyloglobulus sp.]|uniref:hypothetical protein n=1 Tax=Methyloglobulus sp. TaxID=2518622 RepID=UPI0032B781EB